MKTTNHHLPADKEERLASPWCHMEPDLRLVEQELEQLLSAGSSLMQSYVAQLPLKSGKMLRPALVLLSYDACLRLSHQTPSPERSEVHQAAAAIEAIHWASLLHDDVVDETATRRGQATLNSLAGNKFSILLGDYLLTQATQVICHLNKPKITLALAQAAAQMTLGQMLELKHQGNLETTVADYLQIVTGKTAALMQVSCCFGATLAGAPDSICQALACYGQSVGVAFQIADDILDFWGDPATLGKPTFCDLCEEKYTLPVLLALQQPTSAKKVRRLLKQKPLTKEHCAKLLPILDSQKCRLGARQLAEQYVAQALAELNDLPDSSALNALSRLPHFFLERDH